MDAPTVVKDPVDLVAPVALILGGVLAAAPLIVMKRPDARKIIDKIQPYQAALGMVLLLIAAWTLVRTLPVIKSMFTDQGWLAFSVIAVFATALALGVMFGMPIVARFSPQGARKGDELAAKLTPYQVLIGLIAIAAAVLRLALWTGLIDSL